MTLLRSITTSITGWIAWVAGASAAIEFDPGGTIVANTGLSSDSPVQVALSLLQVFFQIIGLVTVILIVYGGWLILSAGGYEDTTSRVTRGKDVIRWAVIGAILILASLGIVKYIDTILA